mmetsp:Transcript_76190/g.132183  ORF Transcript_76190/g.132183 Transcript_76190/m.132183 type:complete len:1154 (+) Transcript_76190:100-3561(+)
MVKSRKKGYDVLSSATDGQNGLFAQDTVRLLQKKGFCIIDDGGTYEAKLEEVNSGIDSIKDKLVSTPADIFDGLLGKDGSAKYAKLDSLECPELLGRIDEQLGTYAGLIMEQTEAMLGFELANRTSGLLMESGSQMGGGASKESFRVASEADDWLQWLEWHRLMVLFIAGPDKATLDLKPFDDDAEEFSVNVEPGMFVILRCDAMTHILKPKGNRCYSIGTFILENNFEGPNARVTPPFPHTPTAAKLEKLLIDFLRQAKETAYDDQGLEEQLGSRELQLQTNRLFIRGDQVAVRSMACRYTGCGPGENFYKPLVSGVDLLQDIIPERWDHEPYFCPDPELVMAKQATYARHCTWIEGIDKFDNKFFGISAAESNAMDPHQRVILEVGYTAWKNAGYSKKTLMRSRFGVFMGSCAFEWNLVPCDQPGFGGTTGSLAINANRVSFQFGLMGPSFSIELEGAASLIAVVQNADACQPGKVQQEAGIAMGADLALAPQSMCLYSYAGWNSQRGRCLTFNETADGHVRGEGVSGITMDNLMTVVDGQSVISQEEMILGVMVSGRSGSCGKTASYGAPNGAAEQELLAMTIRGGDISPLDVDAIECNGLGAILHDAVELAATNKTYRENTTQEMLGLGSVKTNHGHGMRLAGMTSVFKVLGNILMGTQSPHLHLDKLNPHIALEDDCSCLITTECLPNRLLSSFMGVSSKGYNGALAHCIFHGNNEICKPPSKEKAKPSEEISYWPGGGGLMKAELRPNRAYTIVGSWNHWEPEAMDQISRGVYQKTVVLSAAGFERFQIWMDGNKAKTLHPDSSAGYKDGMVHGPAPESETFGSCWQIDGRYKMVPVWKSEEDENASDDQIVTAGSPVRMFKATTNDQAEPGTIFEVRLEVTGKYRTVTWEKVTEETAEGELVPKKELVPVTTYSVMGTFNKWSLEEMTEDSATPGLYYLDVTLNSWGSEFQVVVNGCLRLALYPDANGLTTEGPDELGIGRNFFIDGKAGNTFRIKLQREVHDETPSFTVWWDLTDGKVKPGDSLRGFFAIGSWDQFAKPIPLTFKSHPPRYVFTRPYPDVGTESFQLLVGGERRFQVYPSKADATCYEYHVPRGPGGGGDGMYWIVGKHENDKILMGEDYEVTVWVNHKHSATKVSWSKVAIDDD